MHWLAIALPLLAAAGVHAEPQAFVVDRARTTVGFSVGHLLFSDVTGVFEVFEGTITVDPDDLSTLSAMGTVEVASIQTRNARRDEHLRSEDFFHVEAHPEIRFATTSVARQGDQWLARGDLTIRGVTKVVEVPFALLERSGGESGPARLGFEARFAIDRHDFGITWSGAFDAGGVVVGDEVTIELRVEAQQAP